MPLTAHQNEVYEDILDFLDDDSNMSDPYNLFGLLKGAAGTGKTTCMKEVVKYVRSKMRKQVLCVAPTHKARKVLEQIVNERLLVKVPTCTVASLLNKARANSYIGTDKYVSDGGNKLNMFDVFIIDEVSMIADCDLDSIIKYAKLYEKKILFVGDNHQIPHPTQKFKVTVTDEDGRSCEKKDAHIFSKPYNLFLLSEVVRQSKDNEIVGYYTRIRDNLREDTTFVVTSPLVDGDVVVIDDHEIFEEKIAEQLVLDFKEGKVGKSIVLAYTNVSINHYNNLTRKMLGFKKEFVTGELLMGYANVGFPELICENGQMYIVKKIRKTAIHTIRLQVTHYKNLAGQVLSVQEVYPSLSEERKWGCCQEFFFPCIEDEANYDLLLELVKRADKVNSKNSSKKDFIKYTELKTKIFFRESVYKYGDTIEKEAAFKASHGLLFSNLADVIEENEEGERSLITNELTKKIDDRYPGVRQFRIEDSKPFSDTEHLADRFQVLEKDIDYGYAITVHKSQGSTVETSFIDDTDFDKIKDRFNYNMNMLEKRIKEKNQLRYVAYTRAKKKVFALTKK